MSLSETQANDDCKGMSMMIRDCLSASLEIDQARGTVRDLRRFAPSTSWTDSIPIGPEPSSISLAASATCVLGSWRLSNWHDGPAAPPPIFHIS